MKLTQSMKSNHSPHSLAFNSIKMSSLTTFAIITISTIALSGCNEKAIKETEHTTHTEQQEHDGHEQGQKHELEHEHQHNSTNKQLIPKDYTVNFTVSNHPLFLLSEAVTAGTNTTVIKLLDIGDVGHHASLSPSDIKAIKDSKYVVWFGKALESNLANTLSKAPNAVTLLDNNKDNDKLTILERRDSKAKVIADSQDPHVWLDPNNAKIIVNQLVQLHSKANPKYAKDYQANGKQFAIDLDKLVSEYQAKRPEPKKHEPKKYWSSHDTFQYMEKAMNIELAGTLTTDHEIPIKASQLVWLNKHRPYQTMCLLTQSELREGTKNKLKPIVNNVLVEDMSDSDSYLQAWKHSAQLIESCVNNSK